MVGGAVGETDGFAEVGSIVGPLLGGNVGDDVVGIWVGADVVGGLVGELLGCLVGAHDPLHVGDVVGCCVGAHVTWEHSTMHHSVRYRPSEAVARQHSSGSTSISCAQLSNPFCSPGLRVGRVVTGDLVGLDVMGVFVVGAPVGMLVIGVCVGPGVVGVTLGALVVGARLPIISAVGSAVVGDNDGDRVGGHARYPCWQ